MWMQMGGVSFVWRRLPQRKGREEVGIWGEWQRIELCFAELSVVGVPLNLAC